MPVVAANIPDAVQLTTDRVALESRTIGQVRSQYVIFIDAVAGIFDPENQGNRTVRNWLVQANIVLNGTIDSFPSAIQRQNVINVVERILYATHVNANSTSITFAQQTAVLAAWNASFGALP